MINIVIVVIVLAVLWYIIYHRSGRKSKMSEGDRTLLRSKLYKKEDK